MICGVYDMDKHRLERRAVRMFWFINREQYRILQLPGSHASLAPVSCAYPFASLSVSGASTTSSCSLSVAEGLRLLSDEYHFLRLERKRRVAQFLQPR